LISQDTPNGEPPFSSSVRTHVHQTLESILRSSPFHSTRQLQALLRHLVELTLDGQEDRLKERLIGVELFGRKSDYNTGDDPIVRLRIGDLRKRLAQYYQSEESAGALVEIAIPPGSYLAQFHDRMAEPASHAPARVPEISPEPAQDSESPKQPRFSLNSKSRTRILWLAAVSFLLVLAVTLLFVTKAYQRLSPQSSIEQFWSPVFVASRPVLICLAKPVLYVPTEPLFDHYTQTHPGTFQTILERNIEPLPLNPEEKITWGYMAVNEDYGVATGDVRAAVALSIYFDRNKRQSALRIGSDCSFEDIRNSPTVIVGAFNNRWTEDLTSNLHFVFDWPRLREQGPKGRTWIFEVAPNHKSIDQDYALVTRLIDSKTGQALIVIAGLRSPGTQAAAELVSTPKYLDAATRSLPPGWSHQNLQMVIQTAVHDSAPGPPQVVATYSW